MRNLDVRTKHFKMPPGYRLRRMGQGNWGFSHPHGSSVEIQDGLRDDACRVAWEHYESKSVENNNEQGPQE